MLRLWYALGCALFTLSLSAFPAWSQCDPRVFLVKDVSSITRSGETELAFVLSSTEEEFNNAKQNIGTGGTYGLISGSATWGEAREKAKRIAETTKFDYSSSYAESYFNQSISTNAKEMYLACLQGIRNTPGLNLWLDENKGDFLIFKAFWVGTDTSVQSATFDAEPIVAGGTLLSEFSNWSKGQDQTLVVQRQGRDKDVFINLNVGGQNASFVVVKEPPPVVWLSEPVVSPTPISVMTSWSNPCTAGQQKQCVFTTHPGGSFAPGSAAFNNRSTSDPGNYGESFEYVNPTQVCGTMTQSTGACEFRQSASGTLIALERYPTASP